ncbi:hypothetical protein CMEL01_03742 [Colletotrichum melonis]|uniref:Uncharacterized protein n=1 Tax=Colletotrichum melonis TaxID=1209925 RepID=A0AAI9UCY7_9PEZI|nr:hypothetical protein CMEL01_03742 [Colletotrichum melonis]
MMCSNLIWRYKAWSVMGSYRVLLKRCCICTSFAEARRELMAESWPTLPSSAGFLRTNPTTLCLQG